MLGMPTFDLTTDMGKQDFQKWITFAIKKEINSYSAQVLGAIGGGTGTPTGPAGGALSGMYPDPDLNPTVTGVTSISSPAWIQFDTTASTTDAVGLLNWNDTEGTLEFGLKGGSVILQIGQEQVHLVKHADNTGLSKGSAIYVAGSDGSNHTVRYARANAESTSSKTFGIMAEDATGGAKAFCTTHGMITDINTISLTEGAAVWLSPSVAGGLTTTKPTAPNHLVLLGWCIKSHAVNGSIFVHVVNGFELDELHDVSISSLSDGQVLKYDGVNSVWKNQTLTIPTPVTVSDTAPTSPSANDLWYNSSNGRTYIRYDSFWVEIGNSSVVSSSHAVNHIRGGSDIIDGDRVTIDYNPSFYTRNSAATGAGDVTDLTAHLSGIDNKLSTSYTICTSTTRPSSPYAGQQIYETDTKKVMIYSNATWYQVNNYTTNQLRVGATRTGAAAAVTESPVKWNNILTSSTYYNSTTGLYTCPVAGVYNCFAQVLSNVPGSTYMYLQKNGVDVCFSHGNLTGNWLTIGIANNITCAVNDTIGFRCTTSFYGNDHNAMSIAYLGA